MKKLLILRHAEAAATEIGGSDKTRKLTPAGAKDAVALGKLMSRENLQPGAVLCSSATRTRETLAGVMETLDNIGDNPPIEYLDKLYNADYNILMEEIHDAPSNVENLLVVAHNPGVHMLAAWLAKDDGSALVERLSLGYGPATLTVLACDIEDWAQLVSYSNAVLAVHETSEYNADDRPTRWM